MELDVIVSTQWLYEHFEDPDLIILDASQKDNKAGLKTEYEDVRIRGARFFDLKTFSDSQNDLPNMLLSPEAFEVEARKLGIKHRSKIVVYDNLGVYSSPRVWWMFKIMGHKHVAVLNGGLPEWVSAGFPVKSLTSQQIDRGDFVANFHPEAVKSMHEVLENLRSKVALVVDARSEGRFNGTAREPRAGLPSGHIPGSVNIPFEEVLEDGRFKSKLELQKVFQLAGIADDHRQLIFSCGSGLTACIVLLAAELVKGNQKAVYDGSWTEWAQGDAPIATVT